MNPTVILCPVEFSTSGTAAFAQAVELAKWYEAELHVVHVVGGRKRRPQADEPSGNGGVDKRFSSLTGAVNTDGCRLRTVELGGDPVTAVTEYADLISADVLVVARHGRRSGIYWRPGVYAKALAQAVSCPTLAVPDDAPLGPKGLFVEILCPMMDISAASTAALRQALTLAHQSGGRLTLLHVLDGCSHETACSDDATGRLLADYRVMVDNVSSQLRGTALPGTFNWCHVETKIVSDVAHRSILATASDLGADLIVMGLPERSNVVRVIMASPETPVLQRAGCPVLLVRATAGRDGSRFMTGETAARTEAVGCATRSPGTGALAAMTLEGRR